MAAVPWLALAAACGGGGGGGVDSTPTPPPPPPPPSNANVSLLQLDKSESFTNDGARGTASFKNNDFQTGAASAPISVVYDAVAKSYTITSGAEKQTFRPSDRNAAGSSSEIEYFERTQGKQTDGLSLTKPAESGAFTYKYVAGGLWQRVTTNSDTDISGSVSAFSYGVEAPDASIPRVGAAVYTTDMIGIAASGNGLTALAGSGLFQLNFQEGIFSVDGSGPNVTFTAEGTVASSRNAFSGSFQIRPTGTGLLTGTLDGRFYGPDARELGAVFAATSGNQGSATGVLLGREAQVSRQKISELTSETKLSTIDAGSMFEIFTDAGPIPGGYNNPTPAGGGFSQRLTIDPANKRYTYVDDAFGAQTFGESNRIAPIEQGASSFRTESGERIQIFNIYNASSTGGAIELTYSGFGSRETIEPFPTYTRNTATWFTYGLVSDAATIPRIGTADYSGIIRGISIGYGIDARSTVTGTATFNFNMAEGTLGGTLKPVITNDTTNSSFALGTFQMVGTTNFGASSFTGDITSAAANGGRVGGVAGTFYGPFAQELGAGFSMRIDNPRAPGTDLTASGIIAASRN